MDDLRAQEIELILLLRRVKFGSLTVVLKDGIPVRAEQVVKLFSLTESNADNHPLDRVDLDTKLKV